MIILTLGVGLCIAAFGAVGIIVPSASAWIAQRAVTPAAFYIGAIVRVALGLLLVSVAPASRAPRALRVLGYIILIAGIATGLMGVLAIGRARAFVEWWAQQGPGVSRLTFLLVFAVGAFIAYVCRQTRRAA